MGIPSKVVGRGASPNDVQPKIRIYLTFMPKYKGLNNQNMVLGYLKPHLSCTDKKPELVSGGFPRRKRAIRGFQRLGNTCLAGWVLIRVLGISVLGFP